MPLDHRSPGPEKVAGTDFLTARPNDQFGRRFAPRKSSAILAGMNVGEVLRLLHNRGGYRVPSRGGHRQFKHPTKLGRVTVSGKPSDDLPPGTLQQHPQAGRAEGVKQT